MKVLACIIGAGIGMVIFAGFLFYLGKSSDIERLWRDRNANRRRY